VVARVDAISLTITVKKKRADREEKTLEVGTATKVQVQTAEDETITDRKGRQITRPKVTGGTMADVKAGKQVSVTIAEDGKKAVCVLVLREQAEKKKVRAPQATTSTVTGMVARIDATSLTITVKKKRADPEEKALEVGSVTKVQLETAEDETITDRKGRQITRPKLAHGSMANVKAGKQVTVTIAEDGKKAVSVLVLREQAEKKAENKAP
jgi:phosphopantetheinyl transferase (holo-ACP synthase)